MESLETNTFFRYKEFSVIGRLKYTVNNLFENVVIFNSREISVLYDVRYKDVLQYKLKKSNYDLQHTIIFIQTTWRGACNMIYVSM